MTFGNYVCIHAHSFTLLHTTKNKGSYDNGFVTTIQTITKSAFMEVMSCDGFETTVPILFGIATIKLITSNQILNNTMD